jgi:16S rRNA (adenine1518-N6/adenine1519-N6)-dimethyltransferase
MSFAHKKSLGQNFLNSDYVPKKLCEAAAVSETDTVLEIGPGTGALTRELLQRKATVIALEADMRAIEILENTFGEAIKSRQLQLHHADARALTLSDYGLSDHSFKVVANIPYYLSGLLLRNLLETEIQPTTLVFLMQKELVERIARAEKESMLSLSVKAFGEPSYVATIKRGHFTPPPKVDSAILKVANINRDHFCTFSSAKFFSLLQLGFGSKRKQLAGNLRKQYQMDTILQAFSSLQIAKDIRAEDVDLKTWLKVATALTKDQTTTSDAV